MKVAINVLTARLESALGAAALKSDPRTLSLYAVDGKSPSLLCFPPAAEQVGAALRICAEAEASVVPWGGGTSMGMGNIPLQVDVVIGLKRLSGLVEHDDANLTASAQAGMSLDALEKILRQQNQFLALDPPHPARATLGGIVAANTNGPRRMLYGGVRDLVIGMKMALPTGAQIKAGGKVVKNVAGYDLCKLFVGSLGTLGIVTEVTFKLAPLPESAATVVAWGPLALGLDLADELSRSPLLPAAVTLLSASTARATGMTSGMPAVAVWVEGFAEAVTRHLRDLREMAGRTGLSSDILRDESHRHLWEQIRNFGVNGETVLYRLGVPPASVARVVASIDRRSSVDQPASYIAHAGSGTVWVSLNPDPSSAAWFSRLTVLVREQGGHAVMAAAPPAFKDGVDVWGPSPPSLAIMRAIKRQLDPQAILNPSRFLAGL